MSFSDEESDAEATQIREHVGIWRAQLDKLRSRLTGLTTL